MNYSDLEYICNESSHCTENHNKNNKQCCNFYCVHFKSPFLDNKINCNFNLLTFLYIIVITYKCFILFIIIQNFFYF